MAQHSTGVRHIPATCVSLPTHLDRNALPQQDSLPPLDEVITSDLDDVLTRDELKREADRQTLFQKVANGILGSPNGYRQVKVLIIRWDESIDQFDGHTPEINRLEKIFTKDFGYHCKVARLKNDRDPQVRLNLEVLKHIDDHDNENTLLIVYYTGHGAQVVENARRRLELSACANYSLTGGYAPTAFWDAAERSLRYHTSSDTLVILDCCYASTAALKGRNEDTRTYQLLAASATEGYTTGPGEKSFTTALCDSLEELLRESKGEGFPVIQLSERISTKRTQQPAVIWDRLERYKRSIKLGRLRPNPERESSFQSEMPERASLLLRFSLGTDELSNTQIASLAKHLPEAYKEAGIRVRRMEWVKMKYRDPKEVFREAVKDTMRKNRRQSTNGAGKIHRRRSSQERKKRNLSDSMTLSAPKRPTMEGSPTSVETRVSGCVESPDSLGVD